MKESELRSGVNIFVQVIWNTPDFTNNFDRIFNGLHKCTRKPVVQQQMRRSDLDSSDVAEHVVQTTSPYDGCFACFLLEIFATVEPYQDIDPNYVQSALEKSRNLFSKAVTASASLSDLFENLMQLLTDHQFGLVSPEEGRTSSLVEYVFRTHLERHIQCAKCGYEKEVKGGKAHFLQIESEHLMSDNAGIKPHKYGEFLHRHILHQVVTCPGCKTFDSMHFQPIELPIMLPLGIGYPEGPKRIDIYQLANIYSNLRTSFDIFQFVHLKRDDKVFHNRRFASLKMIVFKCEEENTPVRLAIRKEPETWLMCDSQLTMICKDLPWGKLCEQFLKLGAQPLLLLYELMAPEKIQMPPSFGDDSTEDAIHFAVPVPPEQKRVKAKHTESQKEDIQQPLANDTLMRNLKNVDIQFSEHLRETFEKPREHEQPQAKRHRKDAQPQLSSMHIATPLENPARAPIATHSTRPLALNNSFKRDDRAAGEVSQFNPAALINAICHKCSEAGDALAGHRGKGCGTCNTVIAKLATHNKKRREAWQHIAARKFINVSEAECNATTREEEQLLWAKLKAVCARR